MCEVRRGRGNVRPVSALCAVVLASAMTGAAAQMQRPFPPTALRGSMVVGETPEISLNGRPARLAPGARIRGQSNLVELPASLMGQRLMVHYTVDVNGDVRDAWILTPEEAAKRPWPTTPEQAARWEFDPVAQTWKRQ